MSVAFETLNELLNHGFDTVIDVRSPAEFAEDHVPGAINLPVLDNDERAQVGTMYKQLSPFRARKVGAALVFHNAARHIEGPLASYEGSWRPLVYCWRGGQRSGSFAWMLGQIGWRSELIEGGYKSYRSLVTKALYAEALPHKLVQLGGYTGTAKTALLPKLKEAGLQVVDLEGLAGHRGSLLGEMPGGQPSQKAFETALAIALHNCDSSKPVIVEAESSKIGQINLPPSLWDAMKSAPWIEVSAPVATRAQYLAEAYADILADGEGLRAKLDPLRVHRGHAVVDHWNALIAAKDNVALCQSLAQDHYDPAYERSMRAVAPQVAAQVSTQSLDPAALSRLAEQIAQKVHEMDI